MSDQLAIKLYQSISSDNKPRKMEHWHASSIGQCLRSQYFTRAGVKPLSVPTAAKMLRWQAGHIIEEVIRPHLLKLYPDVKSNQRLTSEKLDLTGEYDNYSEKDKTIFEVKSVHNFAFPHIEREGKPYLGHEYQNHAYVLLLREAGQVVEKITYIYISLDGRIATIETQVNPAILSAVGKRLNLLKAASDDALPPCLCQEDHPLWKSATRYCDYRDGNVCCNENLIKKEKESESKTN